MAALYNVKQITNNLHHNMLLPCITITFHCICILMTSILSSYFATCLLPLHALCSVPCHHLCMHTFQWHFYMHTHLSIWPEKHGEQTTRRLSTTRAVMRTHFWVRRGQNFTFFFGAGWSEGLVTLTVAWRRGWRVALAELCI